MLNEALPAKISELVDLLRARGDDANPSLTEVASVTEVLIATTQAFFGSIDKSIYEEFRSLSDYISSARVEIASLTPHDLEKARIPRAGQELDAIVQATEEATDTIMNSAEGLLASLGEEDIAAQKDDMEAAVMQIFEACSFQDITGQRISKVVSTLAHIEQRIKDLHDVMGITDEHIEAAEPGVEAIRGHSTDELAQGPALEGEGIDQSGVDALMDFDAAPAAEAAPEAAPAPEAEAETAAPAPAAEEEPVAEEKAAAPEPEPTPEPEPEPAPEPAPEPEAAAPAEPEEAPAAKEAADDKPAPEPAAEAAPAPEAADDAADDEDDSEGGRTTSQEEIDALFG